jgi:hypothetical protein
LGGRADRVIDKLPDKIFMLGVIATLYPAARIIFCRRDPRDIGSPFTADQSAGGAITSAIWPHCCGNSAIDKEQNVKPGMAGQCHGGDATSSLSRC